MQYVYDINSSFTVTSLLDLPKLRDILEACNLKPNYSLLGRELGYDRRTIKSHYENGTPDPHRHKPSMIDAFYDIIQTLLSDDTPQQFYYKRVLWQYLVDNHGLTAAYSTFRGYISKIPVFQSYFDRKHTSPSTQHTIRFETAPAEQAQVDWKENIKFLLHDGTYITFNILLMTLGYSRYKLAKVTFDRTTETLQDALVEFFEQLQGVPHVLVTDNMKTVMVQPRLAGTKGQLHTKAEQFSSDFGFTFKPCIVRRPQTKGKVESQMKILDEIHAYQGKLTIQEVEKQVHKIILRSNLAISQATRQIPSVLLAKEKESLTPLPTKVIRDSYRIDHPKAKVSRSNLISFRGSHYSVPPGYVAKSMTLKTIDKMLYIYDSTELIAQHPLSGKKVNYLPSHYEAQLQKTIPYLNSEEVKIKAKSNLEKIGAIYDTTD